MMTSKRYKKLPEKTKKLPAELIEKLILDLKKNCTTKFDESIDLSLQINNKQKKSEINLRTVVNLPSGSGKKIKVAVVCEDSKSQIAKDAGADIVGADDFIEKIKSGELNFEKLICTPSMMIKLSKLGKVLGPKGLMPNPKLGSVTKDIASAVKSAKAGQVQYKNDKSGIVHAGIGKLNFKEEDLFENLKVFYDAILKNKSETTKKTKGSFIKKVSIASTMGFGLEINVGSLL